MKAKYVLVVQVRPKQYLVAHSNNRRKIKKAKRVAEAKGFKAILAYSTSNF